MIKASIYPKTPRINSDKIFITEKIDGSNLVLFTKANNSELYIAQRNTIFTLSEIDEYPKELYKGLYTWLKTYGEELKNSLLPDRVICGEWIEENKMKYDFGNIKFLMFAKGIISNLFLITRLVYNPHYLDYAFYEAKIPEFIGTVPIVNTVSIYPTITYLDSLYEEYTKKVNRNVEGFVINYDNNIRKYVRMKNGTLEPHQVKGE